MDNLENKQLHDEFSALRRQLDALQAQMAVQPEAPEELAEGVTQVLVCQAGAEKIAFPLSLIDEVVPNASLTPLPEAPDWVLGVLNLRGEALPVLDVVARLERRPRETALNDLILVCGAGSRRAGLLVPEVLDVAEFDTSTSRSLSDIPQAPYLLGVAMVEGEQILVLSVSRLLGLSDIPESGE